MAKSSLRKEEFPDLQAGLVPGTGEKTESLSQTWKNACEPACMHQMCPPDSGKDWNRDLEMQ